MYQYYFFLPETNSDILTTKYRVPIHKCTFMYIYIPYHFYFLTAVLNSFCMDVLEVTQVIQCL